MVEKALAKHVLGPTLNNNNNNNSNSNNNNNNNNNNNKSWKNKTNNQTVRVYVYVLCGPLYSKTVSKSWYFGWVVTSVIPLLWMWALFVMIWSGWKHFIFLKVYLMWFWLSSWLFGKLSWALKLTLSICRRTKCRNGKLNENDFSFYREYSQFGNKTQILLW